MNNLRVLLLRLGSPIVYKKHEHPRNILPPISLGYIASSISKKYSVKFFDSRFDDSSNLIKKCIMFKPDVTIAYFMTYDYDFSMKFLSKLKKSNKNKNSLYWSACIICSKKFDL